MRATFCRIALRSQMAMNDDASIGQNMQMRLKPVDVLGQGQ